jgi:hypothetical protein
MQVKELAERYGKMAIAINRLDLEKGGVATLMGHLTPESAEALARVALEYIEERERNEVDKLKERTARLERLTAGFETYGGAIKCKEPK